MTINICGRSHRGPVNDFLVFWLQIAIEPFALFTIVFMIICDVSLRCFTDEIEDFADRTYVCHLKLHQN